MNPCLCCEDMGCIRNCRFCLEAVAGEGTGHGCLRRPHQSGQATVALTIHNYEREAAIINYYVGKVPQWYSV